MEHGRLVDQGPPAELDPVAAEAYHVVITLIAEELGPEPGETAFYRERRFERSFKRRLA